MKRGIPFDVLSIRESNRLTFQPRGRNRLVCNQSLGLGHLTSSQAAELRKRVWPKHREVMVADSAKKSPAPGQHPTRKHGVRLAEMDGHQIILCPHCGNPATESQRIIRTCWHCHKKFRVLFPA